MHLQTLKYAGIWLRRGLSTTARLGPESRPRRKKDFVSLAHIDEKFRSIPKENRNKATFMAAIEMFKKRSRNERGHVEFIISAMNHLKDYNLHKDLDSYKALLNVFPKGPFRSNTVFQRMFMHYPHQQECAITVLDEMEWNHVYPDKEIHDIVCDVFGPWTVAGRKVKRQLYWLPKLRYSNKYLDVRDVENKDLSFIEFAKITLKMICRDPSTVLSVAQMPDQTIIVSGQSPLQKGIIERLQSTNTCYYVDGPFDVYVRHEKAQYVMFSTDPLGTEEELGDRYKSHEEIENIDDATLYKGVLDECYEDETEPTIHEQPDVTILALGMIEAVTQNTASAWVNHLQETNPSLREATVILRIKEPESPTN